MSSDTSIVREGFAVDAIAIETDEVVDLAVTDVALSPRSCGGAVDTRVDVTIRNLGTTAASYSVEMTREDLVIALETVAEALEPGGTRVYSMATRVDLTSVGSHHLTARVIAADDVNAANDEGATTHVTLAHIGGSGYSESFESDGGGWTVEGTNPSWAWGAPAGTRIVGAGDGDSAWVTNLEGPYNNNETSFLVSPCFDLSEVASDPTLSFLLAFDTETSFDEGWLEASVDGGDTWEKVLASADAVGWYNDTDNQWWEGRRSTWHPAESVLTGTAGQDSVRVRFVLDTDFSVVREGFGIDAIALGTEEGDP